MLSGFFIPDINSPEVRPLKISVPKDSEGKPLRFVEGFLDSEVGETERAENLIGLRPPFGCSSRAFGYRLYVSLN